MEDIVYYNDLYDLYGDLLTKKQKEYFEDYYFNNKLEEYEDKLKLLEKKNKLIELSNKVSDKKLKKELEELI